MEWKKFLNLQNERNKVENNNNNDNNDNVPSSNVMAKGFFGMH